MTWSSGRMTPGSNLSAVPDSLGAMTASDGVKTSVPTTARLDQLTVQCEMERRAIRAEFENAQRAAAEWEPTNEL